MDSDKALLELVLHLHHDPFLHLLWHDDYSCKSKSRSCCCVIWSHLHYMDFLLRPRDPSGGIFFLSSSHFFSSLKASCILETELRPTLRLKEQKQHSVFGKKNDKVTNRWN